jgi:hypothetical protein
MKNLPQHLATLSVTAWVGSLWAIGYLAVPVLFHTQDDRHLAGMMAGKLFVTSGYLALFCGIYLLGYHTFKSGILAFRQRQFQIISGMLLIALFLQFGINPLMNDLKTLVLPFDIMDSAYAGQFKILHGISSIAYLTESLLGILLVIQNRQ